MLKKVTFRLIWYVFVRICKYICKKTICFPLTIMGIFFFSLHLPYNYKYDYNLKPFYDERMIFMKNKIAADNLRKDIL